MKMKKKTSSLSRKTISKILEEAHLKEKPETLTSMQSFHEYLYFQSHKLFCKYFCV